jgi:hypothetical protein
MDSLHSTLESIMGAALLYGWRLDAVALTLVLSILIAAYDYLESTVSVRRLRPIVGA